MKFVDKQGSKIRLPYWHEYSDATSEEATAAFISYMMKKASDLHMDDTTFIEPSGFFPDGNYSTANDVLKLGAIASGYPDLVDVWNKKTYSFVMRGSHERTINLSTTVTGSSLENYYHLFGGKTGTVAGRISGVYTEKTNAMVIVNAPDGKQFLLTVLNTNNRSDRWIAAKQLADVATAVYNNPEYDTSDVTVDAACASVILLPTNARSYDNFTFTPLYQKNGTTSTQPASITKVMTSICALDFISDINETFIIKSVDIQGGTGYTCYDGDIISFRDALYSLMLPSANTVANALARTIGHRILAYRNLT